ncbi:MAG: GEVED domain-containing protein, partial [Bacteroidota bacterium]
MKKFCLFSLLSLSICCLNWAPAYAQSAGTSQQVRATHHYDSEEDWLEVMFSWESTVRLRAGVPVDLTTNALQGTDQILDQLAWHKWNRFTDVSEAIIDGWESNGERNTGQDLYNLNNIYRLQIPKGYDIWELSEQLESLPGIYLARPVPKPVIPPSPPPPPGSFQSQQGYLNPSSNNPSGVDAIYAWTQSGGTGAGITVCDLEYSWNYNHADITKAFGSQINPNPITDPFSNTNHGTAVIGELVADNNGWGTTGICYGAGLKTCGTYWPATGGWNVPGALTYAIASLSAGDIILLEQQWEYTAGAQNYIPIEWWQNYSNSAQTYNGVYAAIVTAIANGIHVVEAGGNGNVNTGSLTWYGDSGAIIVGAGGASTSNDRQRLSFSSYGPRFNLQGWGENIVTTGGGYYGPDLYSAEGVNYYYTNTFNGTSGASPIVTGALACTQGYYIATYGATPASPSYMRSHLATWGTAQVYGPSGNIGPRPNIKAAIQNIQAPQIYYDWGDAPDLPYPTLSTNNGAYHRIDGITYLGISVDAESNGQPNPMATGDDLMGVNDDDGVVFTSLLIPGQAASVQVMASVSGVLNAWIDFNGLNVWSDAGEFIFQNTPLTAGVNTLTFFVPANAMTGNAIARFRFNTSGGILFYGNGSNGEVEDYQVFISGGEDGLDWGDAPDGPYPTLQINNGARHQIISGIMLGIAIDSEPNGQPDPFCLGDDNDLMFPPPNDDEDGVAFPGPIVPGQPANVNVTVSAQGFLNAWFDYNNNGSWLDPGEQVLQDILIPAGLSPFVILIPPTALPGQMYARFRFSTIQGLSFNGYAPDGEVEDYVVTILQQTEEYDWGDAPDGPYPTLGVSNGARHLIIPGFMLGNSIDAEPDGQPEPMALGDDNDILYPPVNDDEDGVVFTTTLIPGQNATVNVTSSAYGALNAWIDFNMNGSWGDPGEQIFTDIMLNPGMNTLSFAVPASATAGQTFARFRFSSMMGLTFTGAASDGEVEDYFVTIDPQQEEFDWGDAPEAPYPTLSVSNGANHFIIPGFMLGNSIDPEPDGQPEPMAMGDDNDILYPPVNDDEDGVVLTSALIPGQ